MCRCHSLLLAFLCVDGGDITNPRTRPMTPLSFITGLFTRSDTGYATIPTAEPEYQLQQPITFIRSGY
jgi:hypothetical protein